MLKLQTYTDGAAFLAQTAPAFRTDEVRHGLIYGIAERVRKNPEHFGAAPYLATVHDGERLAAAALMTPPHNLLVYAADEAPEPALRQIALSLIAGGWKAPGVNGVAAVSHTFAGIWQALTGETALPGMALRVFELRQVLPPARVSGFMRPAADADLDLVSAWYGAFHHEAHIREPAPRAAIILQYIREQNLFLWDDGGPVSFAGKGRRTQNGVSVGPVFTPPALRGRGYASACVAALSQLILDEGWAFCTLFTDLANPTSNKIYQQIGYRPVCDFSEIRFAVGAQIERGITRIGRINTD